MTTPLASNHWVPRSLVKSLATIALIWACVVAAVMSHGPRAITLEIKEWRTGQRIDWSNEDPSYDWRNQTLGIAASDVVAGAIVLVTVSTLILTSARRTSIGRAAYVSAAVYATYFVGMNVLVEVFDILVLHRKGFATVSALRSVLGVPPVYWMPGSIVELLSVATFLLVAHGTALLAATVAGRWLSLAFGTNGAAMPKDGNV